MKEKVVNSLFVLVLVTIGLLIYSNTFNSPFHFDDLSYVQNNEGIRSLTDIGSIWEMPGCKGRFVGIYSFAINYYFHKLDTFGYHFLNLIIHVVSAILVWWFVLLIFSTPKFLVGVESMEENKNRLIAMFASLIFLTHPIQTQAVTYISQRLASMAAMFYLLSLCLYIRGRILSIENRRNLEGVTALAVGLHFFGSFLSGVLGMFTKEIVFTLPFAVLLIEFYFFEIKFWTQHINKKKLLVLVLVLFASLLIVPFLFELNFKKIFMMQTASGSHHGDTIIFSKYLLTQFRVIITYLRLLILPINQSLDYDFALTNNLFDIEMLPYRLLLSLYPRSLPFH